jgi:hypothetical protein
MENLIIKTSEAGWLPKIVKAYQDRATLVIVDDAGVGIDPSQDTLFAMGKKAGLQARDWTAVAVALGMAATGIYLLLAAIADPEPFSKMAFTIGAGTSLIMGGGFGAIKVLTGHKPPNVRASSRGFEVSWD